MQARLNVCDLSENLFLMQLRNHPLMSHRGRSSWPPKWTKTISGATVSGEVGTLVSGGLSNTHPPTCCYLTMRHEGATYEGILLVDDASFCIQICSLLRENIEKSIREIGDLDVSHLTLNSLHK